MALLQIHEFNVTIFLHTCWQLSKTREGSASDVLIGTNGFACKLILAWHTIVPVELNVMVWNLTSKLWFLHIHSATSSFIKFCLYWSLKATCHSLVAFSILQLPVNADWKRGAPLTLLWPSFDPVAPRGGTRLLCFHFQVPVYNWVMSQLDA